MQCYSYKSVLAALIVGALTVSAQAIPFTEDFDGAAGGDPTGFNDLSSVYALSGSGTYDTTVAAAVPRNVIYTGFDPAAGEADYTVSATFTYVDDDGTSSNLSSAGEHVTFGVIARYQNSIDTGNFYEARVDGDSFDIVRRGGSGTAVLTGQAHPLFTDVIYTISLTVAGNQLSATLVGSNGTNLSLAPLTANDFADGGAGLRGRTNSSSSPYQEIDRLAIDNFSIVPEPATMTLAAIGGIMLLARRRRI